MKEKKIRKKNEAAFYAPEGEILIVDDIQMNLDVMKGLLKQNKIQVDVATSGKMALEMAEQKKYDMIFMDHMMPEMDGVETFRQIKGSEGPNHSTPVIMLTANAILGVEEEYLGEGFSGYLSKPVQYSHVEEMIIKFLPEEKLHLLS